APHRDPPRRAPAPDPQPRDAPLRDAPQEAARRAPRARGEGHVRDRAPGVVRVPARLLPRPRRPPAPPRLPRDRRPARLHPGAVPRQRRGGAPGALQLLMGQGAVRVTDVVPIYLALPPREIASVRFIFESYEGVAVVRTLDRHAAHLVVLVAPTSEPDPPAA